MHTDIQELNQTTEAVIGCAFRVMNTLGAGFLERVYENALAVELRQTGLAVEQQLGVAVHYKGVVVGAYVIDLLVESTVVLELKAVRELDSVHATQCINYLKATGLPLCLLLNFGNPRLGIQRFTNA